jgi:hypothetical protein
MCDMFYENDKTMTISEEMNRRFVKYRVVKEYEQLKKKASY